MFGRCSGSVREVFLRCSGGAREMFERCSATVREVLRMCFGNVREILLEALENCSGGFGLLGDAAPCARRELTQSTTTCGNIHVGFAVSLTKLHFLGNILLIRNTTVCLYIVDVVYLYTVHARRIWHLTRSVYGTCREYIV